MTPFFNFNHRGIQSVRLSVQTSLVGTPTPSPPPGSVPPPTLGSWGGATLVCGVGDGEPQFRRRDRDSGTLSTVYYNLSTISILQMAKRRKLWQQLSTYSCTEESLSWPWKPWKDWKDWTRNRAVWHPSQTSFKGKPCNLVYKTKNWMCKTYAKKLHVNFYACS